MISSKMLIKSEKIYPKKKLGQNFLNYPSVAEKIVRLSGVTNENVIIELGAGLGALTIPLARVVQKIYAVEKDQQIANILKAQLKNNIISNVLLLEDDIMNVDFNEIAEKENCSIIVFGNLPYNISSQVIIKLIKFRKVTDYAIFMFQKELAQRLAAQPGSKAYGRLTVMLSYCASIKKIADIKASVFYPVPKVDSVVLEIKINKTIKDKANDEVLFGRVVKAAFGKRRKILKNALIQSDLDLDANILLQLLERVNIDPLRRAETISVTEYVKLSNILYDYLNQN